MFYAGWVLVDDNERLALSRLDITRAVPALQFSVLIYPDMTWKAYIYGTELTTTLGTPALLSTPATVKSLLLYLDGTQICQGNRDGKFEELLSYERFRTNTSKIVQCSYFVCASLAMLIIA